MKLKKITKIKNQSKRYDIETDKNHNFYANDILIHNSLLNPYNVFARSHAAPTHHRWADYLKERHAMIKTDLKAFDIEIFGENLFAKHSISYSRLEDHFFMFGVRQKGVWLDWEEVKMYAELFDFQMVPEIEIDFGQEEIIKEKYTQSILNIIGGSHFGSYDTATEKPCIMEGIVTRKRGEFLNENFAENVFKYVRENHVKTDVHWTRNWKRATLVHEYENKLIG